ncbi:GNAT family N-acetyltransferase [Streptomyces virginiae]|uniref:GNAT family N-acetyltransferase n=1 Tax=Streptomyces virginiae TaxID=1961 RepID=UPI0036BDC7FE
MSTRSCSTAPRSSATSTTGSTGRRPTTRTPRPPTPSPHSWPHTRRCPASRWPPCATAAPSAASRTGCAARRAGGTPAPHRLRGPLFYVYELAVLPRLRGRGYGRALLEELVAARTEPHAVLAASTRAPARGLYRRWGWEKAGELTGPPDGVDLLALPLRPSPAAAGVPRDRAGASPVDRDHPS